MLKQHGLGLEFEPVTAAASFSLQVELIKAKPPSDDDWHDWPFDDVLGQIHEWFVDHLTEIMGGVEKILLSLGLLHARDLHNAAA